MAITGSLREAGLADVCQLLALAQKTGCLSVTDQPRFGEIFFKRGRVCFASVRNQRDRLGDLLVRDRAISPLELNAVIERQAREPDRRLGELLVESGLIDKKGLEQYIRRQIEEAVYHLLTWNQGIFSFEVDRSPGDREIVLSLNTENLLLEGARRTDEWELIRQKIASLDLCFQADGDRLAAADISLTAEQEVLIPLLDGSRSVQDLVEASGQGEFEVARSLYGLVQAGLAQQVGRRASPAAGDNVDEAVAKHQRAGAALYVEGRLQEAAHEFRRALELRSADEKALFGLALIDIRQGRDRDALVLLKSLIEQAGPTSGALLDLAFVLARLGRFDDAALALDQAEALRDDMPQAALLRGALHVRLGRPAAAAAQLAEYRRRLDADTPAAAAYYHEAGLAQALGGRLASAAEIVDEGMQRHPTNAALLVLAGALSERRGDARQAAHYLALAAEQEPQLPQARRLARGS